MSLLSSHGTGRIGRIGIYQLNPHILRDRVSYAFPLGSNTRPGQSGVNWSPVTDVMIGETIEYNGERTENPDFGIMWDPSYAPGMALTFGYAGSGKGGLLIPALLTYGASIVANDPKGELEWITGQRRRKMGHKVANADPFGEVQKGYADKAGETEPPTRYNPLAALHPDTPDFAERVATIGEALAIDTTSGSGNALFGGTARDLIEAVIAAEATMNPNAASLAEVRRWLTLAAPEFGEAVTTYLGLHRSGLAASKLRGFADMTNRTNQSTLITAKEQTKFLDNPAIISYFSPEPGEPTFSFDELTDGLLTVYIVLPGRLLGAYSGFSRLMFNQAFEAVQRSRKDNLRQPVTFLIDEAGTSGVGKLDSVEQAYGLARGAGMVLWCFYQDLPQLQRDHPKSFGTFINNSACLTVTGARDQETCEMIANYLGTKTITVTSTGTSVGTNPGGATSGSSTNTSVTGVPVMHAEQIRSMHPDVLLCLMPSSNGNYLQCKLVYHQDPRFNGLYRPDPKYGPAHPAPPYPRGPYTMPPLDGPPPSQETARTGWVGKVLLFGALQFVVAPILGSIHLLFGVLVSLGSLAWIGQWLFRTFVTSPATTKDRRGQWYIWRNTETVGGRQHTLGSIAGWPVNQQV